MLSLLTGHLLSLEGTHPADTTNLHKWVAFFTTLGFVLYYFIREKVFQVRWLHLLVLFLLGGMITATGHLGGNLTHGENFLTQIPPDKIKMIDPADPKYILDAERSGWVISPISKDDHHLRVTGFNIGDSVAPALTTLLPLRTHITELKLSYSRVRDEDLEQITGLQELRKLWIDNTPVTDASISKIMSLKKLKSLNLSNTQISKNAVTSITSTYPKMVLHYEKDTMQRVITDTLFDKKPK